MRSSTIQHDQVRLVAVKTGQSLWAASDQTHVVTLAPEQARQNAQIAGQIVHNEDARLMLAVGRYLSR